MLCGASGDDVRCMSSTGIGNEEIGEVQFKGRDQRREQERNELLERRKLTLFFFLPLSPFRRYSSMKQIYKEEELAIPEGVTVAIKARIITVVGPRGTLQKVRSFLEFT